MLSHRQAKRLADAHLRAGGSDLVAKHATRNRRFGVWIVAYREPARPGESNDGGGLVVTDEGSVHDLSSAPGSLDDLMIALGRWSGAEPATDTDSEALLLLADEDPAEAADLDAYRRRRG